MESPGLVWDSVSFPCMVNLLFGMELYGLQEELEQIHSRGAKMENNGQPSHHHPSQALDFQQLGMAVCGLQEEMEQILLLGPMIAKEKRGLGWD